jgi:DNA-binding response OmpR family regulator
VLEGTPEGTGAVLLVASDLGFVFWLGQTLDRAGYAAFPARNPTDAVKLIATLHLSVTAVIVDESLPDVAQFIATIRLEHTGVKVILLIEDEDGALRLDVDASSCRPAKVDETSAQKWLRLIRRVLSPKPTAIEAQSLN